MKIADVWLEGATGKRSEAPHCCVTCLRKVLPGTTVEKKVIVHGGEIAILMRCLPCAGYMKEFGLENGADFSGCVCVDTDYRNVLASDNPSINEAAYWRRVKYFGYGDEKWK